MERPNKQNYPVGPMDEPIVEFKKYTDDLEKYTDELEQQVKNLKKAYEIVIGKLCYMADSEDFTTQELFSCAIEEVNARIEQMKGE